MMKRLTAYLFPLLALLAPSFSAASDLDDLAKHRWIRVDSPHFSVITEQSEKHGRQVVQDLETMRYFMQAVVGIRLLPSQRPLPILAVGDMGAYRLLGFPTNWGGVFRLSLNGYSAVANIDNYAGESKTDNQSRATVLHEYHHFLMSLTEETQALPKWCSEGMAEYWSSFNAEGDTFRVGDRVTSAGYSRLDGLYNELGRIDIDTERLFNTTDLPLHSWYDKDRETVSNFYSQAFSAVWYFSSDPQRRAALASYVGMINLGYRQDTAAQLAFKMSYKELDKAITRFVRSGTVVRILKVQPGALKPLAISPTVTVLDARGLYASLAPIVDQQAVKPELRRELLRRNSELNPDNADAQVLALKHSALPKQGSAQALAQRFPDDARLLSYRGDYLRRQAEYSAATTLEADVVPLLKQARDYYRRAIKSDPGYPAAYLGLGAVYRDLPAGEPMMEGVVGYDSASVYAPAPALFSAMAQLRIRMGEPLEAVLPLRSAIAFSAGKPANTDPLLLDNLELLLDLAGDATPGADGLGFASGTRFVGTVAHGRPHGRGKMTRLNGSYYEGEFEGGLPAGHGRLVSDSGLTYEGQFKRGLAEGSGKISYPAGSASLSYEGGVAWAAPAGQGILSSRIGRYEGNFAHGREHGAGVFTASAAPVTLRGTWIRGAYSWPLDNDVQFTGPVGAGGLRDGAGLCRAAQAGAAIEPCTFKGGRKVEAKPAADI